MIAQDFKFTHQFGLNYIYGRPHLINEWFADNSVLNFCFLSEGNTLESYKTE